MSTTDPQTNETISALQNHVAHLTSLLERIHTLRKIPGLLLAPSTLTGSQLEHGFEQINDLKDVMGGPVTQDCLKLAEDSFSKSSDNIGLEGRRQSRKRRRPPSPIPDSPRPPPALPKHIFPPSSRSSHLSATELPSYFRENNKAGTTLKLHLWTPTRPKARDNASHIDLLSQSREIIPNPIEDSSRLIVENVTVFGPREAKSPHSQSDFTVFLKLSQHLAWMIQAEPDVTLESLVALFNSYETLFVSQCTVCHRVLSEEGHFPPVCRIWTPLRRGRDTNAQEKESGIPIDDSDGKWEPRHKACLGV
ncbi:hypothetical protein JB92DRAFT_835626 [Gautieria morchelliformis]|nr:hypothetical protein JB92DRAFT_835626 [Gautieria morchelliformis]